MLSKCILSHFATRFVAFCDSLFRAKAVPLHRISKRAEIANKSLTKKSKLNFMEFVGIIVAVSNVEEKPVNDSQGYTQCYRDIVVQTQEEFPKGICATLKGDAARNFDLTEGSKVRVFFETRVNQSKASGKWFTSCHAWRIDAV